MPFLMASSSASHPPPPPPPLSERTNTYITPTHASTSSPPERLIFHLVASKRSLSSIVHVQRANDLTTFTKDALQHTAVTKARTSFLCSGIASQLSVLGQVHQSSMNTGVQVRREFEAIVKDLDGANARLRVTMDHLRNTLVESKLRPAGEDGRHLLDFVDEGGVEGVYEAVRRLINGAGTRIEEFETYNKQFGDGVKEVGRIVEGKQGPEPRNDVGDNGLGIGMPILDVVHDTEDHAREMAVGLESLVSHFDLCVRAIKHIEGGGDAALKIASDLPEGMDLGQDATDLPEPINDEQWMEMIRVLEEDARQVDDVVMEIREHMAEMESLYKRVNVYTNRHTQELASATAAFKLLEDIGKKLPGYVTQSQVFPIHWEEEKEKIEERLEELESSRDFYDGFLGAYDNLLIEVGRRKAWELKMEKVVQAAKSELQKIYEDDLEEREAFTKAHGHFLPRDIWPGLPSGPLRFNISPVDETATRVPDISKSVIHRAIRRVHGEQ